MFQLNRPARLPPLPLLPTHTHARTHTQARALALHFVQPCEHMREPACACAQVEALLRQWAGEDAQKRSTTTHKRMLLKVRLQACTCMSQPRLCACASMRVRAKAWVRKCSARWAVPECQAWAGV